MSDTPKIIYRRPDYAGTKPVIRAGSPMRTLDTRRLALAGSLSKSVRRRGLVNRAVIFLLLLGLLALAVVLIASASERASAQTFVISAPCLHCVYLPMVMQR